MSTTNKLTTLTENKTLVFYSPIEGKDVLVRTGVINGNTSFVHSVLHAYSKEYVKMDNKGREKTVQKLLKSVENKLQEKRKKLYLDNIEVKLAMQDKIKRYLTDFYNHISKNIDIKGKTIDYIMKDILTCEEDKQIFSVLFDMITLEEFKMLLEDNEYRNIADTFERYVHSKLDDLGEQLDERRRDYCINKTGSLMTVIVSTAKQTAVRDYGTNNKDNDPNIVDDALIKVISEKLNRDIYFIDGNNRMPYQMGSDENIKGRKSVILIWIGGLNYEVVGRLLPHNKIQREFTVDDSLIRRINMFVYRPELISDHYPNLIPYLPKEQKDIDTNGNKSDEDENSESSDESNSGSEDESEEKPEDDSEEKPEEKPKEGKKNSQSKSHSTSSYSRSNSRSDSSSHSSSDSETESSSKSRSDSRKKRDKKEKKRDKTPVVNPDKTPIKNSEKNQVRNSKNSRTRKDNKKEHKDHKNSH